MYRFVNLGVGDANAKHADHLGQPFAICDDCVPNYDLSVTNNIDTRLIEDCQERLPETAVCEYYGHKYEDA